MSKWLTLFINFLILLIQLHSWGGGELKLKFYIICLWQFNAVLLVGVSLALAVSSFKPASGPWLMQRYLVNCFLLAYRLVCMHFSLLFQLSLLCVLSDVSYCFCLLSEPLHCYWWESGLNPQSQRIPDDQATDFQKMWLICKCLDWELWCNSGEAFIEHFQTCLVLLNRTRGEKKW